MPIPKAFGVSPPPDGGYANDNTAEGNGALFNLTSGHDNTATGNIALLANTTGSLNTATGSFALQKNTTGNDNTGLGFGTLFQISKELNSNAKNAKQNAKFRKG